MAKFAYNEAGRVEAITYLKIIGKYDYIRGVVHELSLDLVDYANCVFKDKEHAFFLPKDGESFKSANKARHYLYFKGKLKELNKITQDSWNVIGYANALRQGKGKAFIKRKIAQDKKYKTRQPAVDVVKNTATDSPVPNFWSSFFGGVAAGVATSSSANLDEKESMNQCKHCGQMFNVTASQGWKTSKENFTCDFCYRDGKRDWATYYHDENVF